MEGKLTIEKAITGHQLSAYKAQNRADLQLQISAMFLDLARSFALGEEKTLTVQDANGLAMYLLQNHWHLKLSELYLFIENAKNGKYGKIYHGLTRAVIMEWLTAYELERDAVMESTRSRKRSEKELTILGLDHLAAIKLHLPEAFQQLIDMGKRGEININEGYVSEETKAEQARVLRLSKLIEWFPAEMDQMFSLATYLHARFGKWTSTTEMLNNRKVRKLEAIILERTQKPKPVCQS